MDQACGLAPQPLGPPVRFWPTGSAWSRRVTTCHYGSPRGTVQWLPTRNERVQRRTGSGEQSPSSFLARTDSGERSPNSFPTHTGSGERSPNSPAPSDSWNYSAPPGVRGAGRAAMSKSRFLLKCFLKLCLAAACLVASIAGYRLLLHPLIESAFLLGEHASSIVRRVNIFVAVVLSYWAFVHFYERRAAQELSPRWRWIVLAAVAGSLSIGVTILALYATGHYQLISFRGFGPAAGILATIWVAAVLEEVAFRGILFRILEEGIGTRAALVASAMIFCVAHMANNGVHWVTVLSITLAGLMWALVFIVSRNLWVAAAHHCCWNATIFMIGLPLSGEDWRAQAPLETASHGSILWTGGAFGPEDSLINLFVSLVICAVLWRLAQRADKAAPSL